MRPIRFPAVVLDQYGVPLDQGPVAWSSPASILVNEVNPKGEAHEGWVEFFITLGGGPTGDVPPTPHSRPAKEPRTYGRRFFAE